jgi:fatty-acyl-CoA synthase
MQLPRPQHHEDPTLGTRLEDWLKPGPGEAAVTDVLGALEWQARQRPQAVALLNLHSGDDDERPDRITYAELGYQVRRRAALLAALGAHGAAGVATMLPATPETQYVLWGAETAALVMPLNPLLAVSALVALVQAGGAVVLVAAGPGYGAEGWAKAQAVCAAATGLKHLLVVEPPGRAPALPSRCGRAQVVLMAEALRDRPAIGHSLPRRQLDDRAALFHTGGTTGAPKLVPHTHRNQLAAALGGAAAAGLQGDDVVSNGFPLFHVAGTIFSSLAVFMAGGTVVLMSPAGFRNPQMVQRFWRLAERHRFTVAAGIPTAMGAIARVDPAGADLSALRQVLTGGAALPAAVAHALHALTSRPVREVLGMTEAGGVIACDRHGLTPEVGGVGHPVPFCRVQVRALQADGQAGDAALVGQPGVVVVQGDNVTPRPGPGEPAWATFTADGWLVTGDLGVQAADGRLRLTGRAKDLIIRSGHNIDPALIEEVLLAFPGVAAAAAVGRPDGYAGEIPVAYVVPAPGLALDLADLEAYAREHIAERPAWPKSITALDALPLTAVGKVYKPRLREDAAARHVHELLHTALPASAKRVVSALTQDNGRLLLTVSLPVGPGTEGWAQRVKDTLSPLLLDVQVMSVPAQKR